MIQIKRKPQPPAQTPATRAEMAQIQPEAQRAAKPLEARENALKGQIQPFTGLDSRYKAMYRAACEYHARHNPPRLDDDGQYWIDAADDMAAVCHRFNDDPFIIGLLIAVYSELERGYLAQRGQQENEAEQAAYAF